MSGLPTHEAVLELNSVDLNIAVQYWLNREVFKNECYVRNIKWKETTNAAGTVERIYMVKFTTKPEYEPEEG